MADDGAGATSGTGSGFLAFFDHLIRHRELLESTASAMRTSSRRVLAASGEDPSALDLRTADVDDLLRRFRAQVRGSMRERSTAQYEQRFRTSVEMYRRWLDDDPDWLPARLRGPTAASRPSPRPPTRAASPAASPAVTPAGRGRRSVPAVTVPDAGHAVASFLDPPSVRVERGDRPPAGGVGGDGNSSVPLSEPSDAVRSPATAPSGPAAPEGPPVLAYPFPVRRGVVARLQLPADLTAVEVRRLAAFVSALALEDGDGPPQGFPAG